MSQSTLVRFCHEATVQWEYGFLSQNADARSWLDTVFDAIHSAGMLSHAYTRQNGSLTLILEPAAISGNWRSLVHRHAARVAADSHGKSEDMIALRVRWCS